MAGGRRRLHPGLRLRENRACNKVSQNRFHKRRLAQTPRASQHLADSSLARNRSRGRPNRIWTVARVQWTRRAPLLQGKYMVDRTSTRKV